MIPEPAATRPRRADVDAEPEVELFRTDDYTPSGTQPLMPLLCEFFEPLLGTPLDRGGFRLSFLRLADTREPAGRPAMVNLRASHGWVQVQIVLDRRLVYQHPHSVREIIGGPLQRRLAAEHPDESHWGYAVRAPGMEEVPLVRPAPTTSHWGLSLDRRRRSGRFVIEEIPEPEPPTATLADLGMDDGVDDPGEHVGVVIDLATYDVLTRHAAFSSEVEEGGFLAGQVYRSTVNPEGYLVKVTAAIPAERTGASLMHFTFTGESFLRIAQRLDSDPGQPHLIGWYHTHLFAASAALGLSSIDVELHTSTFRKPAQVAGLVNIDGSARVLRFYRSEGSRMAPAPYWVAGR